VETFGSSTVRAIIDYKWKRFARRQIYTKSLVYLVYVLLFTVFAVLFSDDQPSNSFHDLTQYPKGLASIMLACEWRAGMCGCVRVACLGTPVRRARTSVL
jgi:hypothetical protein